MTRFAAFLPGQAATRQKPPRLIPQPVVANRRLRNLPDKAIFNWQPGAQLGIYRPDTFWFADQAK